MKERRRGATAQSGRSADAIAQRRLHFRTGLKSAKDLDGRDRCPREIGRNVRGDDRQAENLDMKRFAGRTDRLEIGTAVLPQTKIELASRHRLLHRIGVTIELGADRCPDEVGAVGIEALPDQQIDVAEIDEAHVDGELFAVHDPERCLFSHLERFRLLVNAVTDYAIYMLDASGNIASWNAGAERFKGYTAREIIGRHFSTFYTEEDIQRGIPATALQTSERTGKFEAEGWRVRKDGTRFWAHVIIDPIRSPSGALLGFAKVTRDLTERRGPAISTRRGRRCSSRRRWRRSAS